MRSPGSRAPFTAIMLLAALLGLGGVVEIASRSGSTLLGIVLMVVAFGLSRYAKNARAAHIHREKMTGLWQWAQGLGPRNRRGGTRSR